MCTVQKSCTFENYEFNLQLKTKSHLNLFCIKWSDPINKVLVSSSTNQNIIFTREFSFQSLIFIQALPPLSNKIFASLKNILVLLW